MRSSSVLEGDVQTLLDVTYELAWAGFATTHSPCFKLASSKRDASIRCSGTRSPGLPLRLAMKSNRSDICRAGRGGISRFIASLRGLKR